MLIFRFLIMSTSFQQVFIGPLEVLRSLGGSGITLLRFVLCLSLAWLSIIRSLSKMLARPITDHGSWFLDDECWITDFGPRIMDHGFWITDLGSQNLNHRSWKRILDHHWISVSLPFIFFVAHQSYKQTQDLLKSVKSQK